MPPLVPRLVAALVMLAAPSLRSQPSSAARAVADSLASVTIIAVHDTTPVDAAIVRALGGPIDGLPHPVSARTDARGVATLRLPAGERLLVASRFGYRPDTIRLQLRAGQDTTVLMRFVAWRATLEGVVISATRGERRVEDSPLRVEVIDEEEVAEKVAMTPGDIAMMLNETSGMRVQTSNPSLGGAFVRVQGLRGRYTLLLADGLPLYGGQAGGLGLLQIPPVDLGRVEVIKGAASALYGSSALGGVINLVSIRPRREVARTLLFNRSSRGGSDGVFFGSGPVSRHWGYTLLAGGHGQRRNDVDGDEWADMPGYERAVIRPRLHFDDGAGHTAFVTGGFTAEQRSGGTLPGRVLPQGAPHVEALRTRRADGGGLVRWVIADSGALAGVRALHGSVVTLRASATSQAHRHRFGAVLERDQHRTWFGEASLAVPRGRVVTVLGAAFQQDAYRAVDVDGFDYTHSVPAAFAQVDIDPASWIAASASARLDAHSEYGTFLNPRLSLLLRWPFAETGVPWSARLSGGTGAFAPTPFSEETDATGLTPLERLNGLAVERARSASLDIGGPLDTRLGALQLNLTAFGSRIARPLQMHGSVGLTADGASRISMVNASGPTQTWGGEVLARLMHEFGDGEHAPSLRVTTTYTYLRATECDAGGLTMTAAPGRTCARREVPMTPRHAVGAVASIEREGRSRVGLEVYHTGRQSLADNPYRDRSRPYVILGLLAERVVPLHAGVARLFLNLENLGNVRQSRFDPLVLPSRGPGGRWTTDAWTELVGFTLNGGVRFTY